MKLVVVLLLLAQQIVPEGNGFWNPDTPGNVIFRMPPCYLGIQSPEAQHESARKRAEERFEAFKQARPTTYRVHAWCHTDKFTDQAFDVEKVVAIVEGKPVFPIEIKTPRQAQQNAFGASRSVQIATATFAPPVFDRRQPLLTINVVHSNGRIPFILLPGDLAVLAGITPPVQTPAEAARERLQDADEFMRKAALDALVAAEQEKAVPALIKALSDPAWGVRARAVALLGDLGPKARNAVDALDDAARDDARGVTVGAQEALRKIRGR